MEKQFITWQEVDECVDFLVQWVQNSHKKVTGVYGLPRGGLVLAVMLSHRLHVPLLGAPTQDCVIVDDLSDSGQTLWPFRERYTILTMHCKMGSLVVPNAYFKLKPDAWVVYPWEAQDESSVDEDNTLFTSSRG